MSYHDQIAITDLVAILSSGGSWSTMAGLAGFADGSNFRRHCLSRGLRRKIKGDVVIIIADPV